MVMMDIAVVPIATHTMEAMVASVTVAIGVHTAVDTEESATAPAIIKRYYTSKLNKII